MTLLTRMKEAAERATPGVWRHGKWTGEPNLDWQVFCDELEVTPCLNVCLEQDAQHIALSCPQNVLKLLEIIETQKRALERISPCKGYFVDYNDEPGTIAREALKKTEEMVR